FLVLFLPRDVTWRVCQKLYRSAFWLAGIRVRVSGLEHLSRGKPYVLMGNHVNFLDPFMLCVGMPVPTVALEKNKNFGIPIYGWVMRRWGTLSVDRGKPEQARLDLARAGEILRRDGSWLILFPEGTRTRDGRVGPFKKGGFHLALSTGVEIVPFTQNGARDI